MPDMSVHKLGLGILLVAPEGERGTTGVTGDKILHSQYFPQGFFLLLAVRKLLMSERRQSSCCTLLDAKHDRQQQYNIWEGNLFSWLGYV